MRCGDIPLKTSADVARIRKPAQIVERVLREAGNFIRPGISTAALDLFCSEYIRRHRGTAALHGYRGYPGNICASVNEVAAHGTPGKRTLREGDIVTVDATVGYGEWFADSAWTYAVGETGEEARTVIKAAWQACIAGILAARPGNRIGSIGAAVQRTARRFGCSVLEDFAGHGIGRELHEDPLILHVGTPDNGLPIVPGMVFTIEPVLCLGTPSYRTAEDGWSCVMEDGSLTAQFEHTIAVFSDRTEILTFPWNTLKDHLDYPPFF